MSTNPAQSRPTNLPRRLPFRIVEDVYDCISTFDVDPFNSSHIPSAAKQTQCITGAVLDVAFVNMDLRSINWKQLGEIFFGWVLSLPCAGLISGRPTSSSHLTCSGPDHTHFTT
ncbi:hypothetical protein ACN38_g5502 [Penicillium nordicum]|uniref:Uncharacterized protein n=1 Tax=Penicillium nordicum TaxID=229535 RepID=A0A0M9WGA8_9EURO|nr:hypothetical protein ACN38_g5502 [Penicillium nordicum]